MDPRLVRRVQWYTERASVVGLSATRRDRLRRYADAVRRRLARAGWSWSPRVRL